MSRLVGLAVGVGVVLAAVTHLIGAEQAEPLSALARMPVKEITVFKDGHAFLMHRGRMPVDARGNVVMDYLPSPVLGTFWPFSADRNIKLSAVTAGQRRVVIESTSLNLRALIEGNVGAEVVITEVPTGKDSPPLTYPATILSIPLRTGEELEAIHPPNTGEKLPEKGEVVLLKTVEGVKVVRFDRIQDLTFKGEHKVKSSDEAFRNLLTLKLEWPGNRPAKDADVGLFYLQRGVRWIPNYRIVINGKGNAAVKLQATLINELTDLEDVTANLVIGVPTFAFQDTADPIGLQQTVAQLSQYFRKDSQTAGYLSNAMMSQTARMTELPGVAPGIDLGPEVEASGRSEDLFVFTVKHVTLKKGQRMVMPVAEFDLPYRDVFTLDLPFAPPPEIRGSFNTEQQRRIAQLLDASKVMHKLRLANKSEYPLTTAPALILRDDRILAQGLMTYTPVGADVDAPITNAVDIRVKKTDTEAERTPNAVNWQGSVYGRIDLSGTINLTNFRKESVELEVTRHVLGNILTADHDGKIEMVNIFEDDSYYAGTGPYPYWWPWYNWPYWWHHFNGVGRIRWTLKLEPNKAVDLGYTWNYYWR